MSETESLKVYELAKELSLPPLELVDKLNGLGIKVKSHMSDLSSDDATRARSELGEKKAAPAAKKAASKTRKKADAASSATEAPPAAKTTAAKATASKSAAAKTAKTAAKAAAPEAPAPAPAASAQSPIIRRRVKADGVTETLSAPVPGYQRQTDEMQPSEEAAYEMHGEEGAAHAHESAESYAAQQAAYEAAVAEQAAEQASAGGASAAEAAASATGAEATASSASPGPETSGAPKTRAPIVLPPRPVAPRRSILKVVEVTAPPPRPMIKPSGPPPVAPLARPKPGTPGAAGAVGDRVFKMTKENLDQMAEEEAAKKRGGGGGRIPEVKPEDVRFADYRKKEMVFLPKKKKLPVGKQIKQTQVTQAAAHKRVVQMEDTITVQDFANQLSVKAVDVVRKLMKMGVMASINQVIDFDTATLIAGEYQYEVKNVAFKEESLLDTTEDKPEQMQARPPVVTIMGHVDHGKTTLLDSIREANVAGGEAGGITQHIGAYTVYPKDSDGKARTDKPITFIDTPGHEAFSVMRARGANVTDIVILVVSADDGVMPQTREALSHAQAAKVPIIVAVNKIDKPGANPEKIKQGLSELNLLAEDWGGDTMFVPVSALKKTNLDKLLEAILLQAEVLDLKGNPEANASGTVLEARLEKGRGPVVSVLISRGTLRPGDAIVAGPFSGKVRALTDDQGRQLQEVTPGLAAEILGFEGVPNAGETFNAVETEADARKLAATRVDQARAKISGSGAKVSLEDLFAKVQAGEAKELNVVVKADVFGSVEAIKESLVKLSTPKVKVKVLLAAPGGITESDVLLASASGAIIVGFNVRPETKARQVAEAEHVEIKSYTIIYELLDDIKGAMTGLLDKKKVEKFLGRAEVRQTFNVPKVGTVAGTAVIDGKIIRGANVRLLRDSRIIFDGKMATLRRFKDDAKEVASGFECGIGLENYNDLKPGDIIEAYQIEMITPELDSAQ
jgi:translation initiation factor IF-2